MKKGTILVLYFLIFIMLLFIIAGSVFNRGMSEIRATVVMNVDVSTLSDGIYKGDYCVGRWCYSLSVTVIGHRIQAITTNNSKMDMFKELNQKLAESIIREQKIPVDAVSGASITSKAFQKAVENALKSRPIS